MWSHGGIKSPKAMLLAMMSRKKVKNSRRKENALLSLVWLSLMGFRNRIVKEKKRYDSMVVTNATSFSGEKEEFAYLFFFFGKEN